MHLLHPAPLAPIAHLAPLAPIQFVPLTVALPTTACITMFSKSRRNSWLDVFVITTATRFCLRSTQKCVPNAPLQPKLPSDSQVLRAIGSLTTRTLRL